jgi:uncharacterized protein (TIGR00255 family)
MLMIRSMTGFGQSEHVLSGYKIQVGVKSVNHRFSEIVVRLPREWIHLEDLLRKQVQKVVRRGRVDVLVHVEKEAAFPKKVMIDWGLAEGYLAAAEQLKERFSFTDSLTLNHLLLVPDMITFTEEVPDPSAFAQAMQASLDEALAQLLQMRQREGEYLCADLTERFRALEDCNRLVQQRVPQVIEEYRAKLRERIVNLLDDPALFEEHRFAMEVALMAERSNIDEECTRLASHISQCRELLKGGEPAGRQLNFLVQEMNREINTMGAKSLDTRLTNLIVSMKAELEKIREQVQNIE